MAKKRGDRKAQKKAQENRNKIIIYVVALTMLLSGAYMLSERSDTSTPAPAGPQLTVDEYSVRPIFNSSMVLTVKDVRPELAAKVDEYVYSISAIEVLNASIEGLVDVTFEAGNPRRYSDGYIVGDYLLFRFRFDEVTENATSAVRSLMDSEVGAEKYQLMAACAGTLPVNISGPGTDEVYFPCPLGTQAGEHYRAYLLEKRKGDLLAGLIGFAAKKVAFGPIVEAEVVNVSGYLVQGTIESEFSAEAAAAVGATQTEMASANIVIEEAFDERALAELNAMPEVHAAASGNQTTITYNRSQQRILAFLAEKNATYKMNKGDYAALLPLDADIAAANATLAAAGVGDAVFKKTGAVSMPPEVVFYGSAIASIQDNGNFAVLLKADRKIGDVVNVSLQVLQFGDQVYVVGGSETD